MIRQVITNLWNSYSCKKCHDLIHYEFNSDAHSGPLPFSTSFIKIHLLNLYSSHNENVFRMLYPTNFVTEWIISRKDRDGFDTAIRVFDDRIWWWHCILLSQTLLAYNNFMKNSWNIIWSKVKGLLFILKTKRVFYF